MTMATTAPPMTAPAIIGTPLTTHRTAANDIHRIVASASSLSGNTTSNSNNNNAAVLLGCDGGDIIATVINNNDDDDGRRRVVVKRMDGATIASFELPPSSSSSNSSSVRQDSSSPNNGNNDIITWNDYQSPILCWASFSTKTTTTSSSTSSSSTSSSEERRKMLCVLGNPTTLFVYDVLGDATLLATTTTVTTTNGGTNGGTSSSNNNNNGGGPAGHTIPLPFRASSIHPNDTNNGNGILLVRMPSEQDYNTSAIPLAGAGSEDYNVIMGGVVVQPAPLVGGMLPPQTPTGFSLPATPRNVSQRKQEPSSSGTAAATAAAGNNNAVVNVDNMEEEELSLEDPPIPVRFTSTGGEGGNGEVTQQPFDPQEVLPYPHHQQQHMIGGEASMVGGEASIIGGGGFPLVAQTEVPNLFTLCHPLDEIRPLAVRIENDENEDNKNNNNHGNIKLFSDVDETLVYFGTPRLFHGTTTSTTCSTSSSICVTYNRQQERHTIWSIEKACSVIPTLPLWKTTGRGTWRMLEGLNENNGDDDDEVQQQEQQVEVAGGDHTNNGDEDVDEEDVSMSQSSNQQQQQDDGRVVGENNGNGGGGMPQLSSSFSDIHPDFTLKKLLVEDVITSFPAVATDNDDATNSVNGVQETTTINSGHDSTNEKTKRFFQRHVFLATDMFGKGDLILCLFGKNNRSNPNPSASLSPKEEEEEPAMLRCYSLHLPKTNHAGPGGAAARKMNTIESVSHLVDLPCTSAQPIQSLPIPLAPFSLVGNNNDNGGGDDSSSSSWCGGSRWRNTSRFQRMDLDTFATDILVLQRQPQEQVSSLKSLKLGLYRAGLMHITDFTLPQTTLDNLVRCSSPPSSPSSSIIPVGLQNAVGNRVDVQFIKGDGDGDGDESSSSETTATTVVRASFSLVMDSSPVTEAALRAIESSLVHGCCSSANSVHAILPYLFRADCMRLFQQQSTDQNNNGGSKNKMAPRVEDDAWYALTEVLLNVLGLKRDGGNDTQQREEDLGNMSAAKKQSLAWEALLQSDFHATFSQGEGRMLFGDDSLGDLMAAIVQTNDSPRDCDTKIILSSLHCLEKFNVNGKDESTLLLTKQSIFDTLHLLHEDSRLVSQSRGTAWTRRLGTLLLHISEQMGHLVDFEDHYRRHLGSSRCLSNACSSYSSQQRPEGMERLSKFEIAPCIMTCLDSILQLNSGDFCAEDAAYGIEGFKDLLTAGVNGVCSYTWMVLRLFGILFDPTTSGQAEGYSVMSDGDSPTIQRGRDRAAIIAMLEEGIYHSVQLQDELPVGVLLPLLEAIRRCRLDPPQVGSTSECWPAAAFDLVGRNDLAEFLSRSRQGSSPHCEQSSAGDSSPPSNDPDNDGLVALEDYSSMVFPDDNRVREAARLLRSSRTLFLRVPRPVELSDHDYERSKQEKLLLLSRRSLALPLGRGMITLGTRVLSSEQLLIPNIVLAGRVPPGNGTLALDMSTCPANFRVWPEFHNGVAAGLRLPPTSAEKNERTITRTWIKFNRPSPVPENTGNNNERQTPPPPSYAHGGFLMALGLRGYLSALTTTDLTDYLTEGTITTTVGIFLGMAANKRGSCDPGVSKMLCLHVPSLLPPSFIPMDLASTVQAGAVAGIGILYQGSSHRLMTEFLLNEIGRQPLKDQNSNDREGFALVCGLALGMVNLEKGMSSVSGCEDLRIEERLNRYITGRSDGVDATSAQGEMDKNSRIYEVNSLNRDITAPGATLALGLMYIKSHNLSVASSLDLPGTHFSLDYIRPDLLALRVISRSLILWDHVEPTPEWIDAQIPSIVSDSINLMKSAAKKAINLGSMPDADRMDDADEHDKAKKDIVDFDPQAIRQANAFIISGACFSLGLKYAGSADRAAASAIIERALWFLELRDNKDVVTLAQRPDNSTLITCLCTAAISLAMVMAGTGDLDSFRLLRTLRWKCDDSTLYGTHMAFSAAIGLLFLGGGKCTLGSSPGDIAMLIAALYPHYPILSSDNQYHLQALRHLYVLAVHDSRIEAIDVDSNEKVCIPIELSLANKEAPVHVSTPFLVANNSELVELRSNSDRYYPIVINMADWNTKRSMSTIFVKRKAGHLSYVQDPNGLRSLSMQSGKPADHESFLKSIKLFSDDAVLSSFANYFCFSSFNDDASFERFCNDIAYECMKDEKSDILPVYLKMFRLIESKSRGKISIENVWDSKLLRTYVETREWIGGSADTAFHLVNRESINLLCESINKSFHIDESALSSLATTQSGKWWDNNQSSFGSFLVWNEIPIKC